MFAVTSLDVSGQNFDRVFIKTVDIDIGDNHDCSFSKKFLQRVMDPVWQKKSINFILDHEILSHLGQLTSTPCSRQMSHYFVYFRQEEDSILEYMKVNA